jgi:hypothetical protein
MKKLVEYQPVLYVIALIAIIYKEKRQDRLHTAYVNKQLSAAYLNRIYTACFRNLYSLHFAYLGR